MAYILRTDYLHQIEEHHFDQITSEDAKKIAAAERDAISEARGYLETRFELDNEMIDVALWSPSVATYTTRSMIYLDAAEYDSGVAYVADNLVEYEDEIYICILAGTNEIANTLNFTKIGTQYELFYGAASSGKTVYAYTTEYSKDDEIFYKGRHYTAKLAHSGVKPDDVDNGTTYWTNVEAYAITAGVLPSVAASWTSGDIRNAQLLRKMKDIVIFYLLETIAPRSVSELRMEAYNRAIKWLTDVSLGKLQTTMELIQDKGEQSGLRPRFGYKTKNVNNY